MREPVLFDAPLLAEQLASYAADPRFCPEERAHFRELSRLVCMGEAYVAALEAQGRLQRDYGLQISGEVEARARELAEEAAGRALRSFQLLHGPRLKDLSRPRYAN
jgi:hypothetical protein